MARARRDKARPDIVEAADADVVTLYAPKALIPEIEKYIPILAREKNIPKPHLWDVWKNYRRRRFSGRMG
jgi:hypothetical protein